MLTKIDKIDKKCTDLETKADRIDEIWDNVKIWIPDLNRSEVRNEQKFNERFTSLASQISTMSSDIKGVSEHINRVQYEYIFIRLDRTRDLTVLGTLKD